MATVYYVDAQPGQITHQGGVSALPRNTIGYELYDDDDSSTSTISSEGDGMKVDDDEASDSEYESEESETMVDEIEDRIEAFVRVGTTPALAQMVFDSHAFRLPGRPTKRSGGGSVNSMRSMRSTPTVKDESPDLLTAGQLAQMLQAHRGPPNGGGLKRSISDVGLKDMARYSKVSSESSVSSRSSVRPSKNNDIKPWDFLGSLMDVQGIKLASFSYSEMDDDFFSPLEPCHHSSYDNEIAQATRLGDLNVLRSRHQRGGLLLACNRFRETTVHTVCRRGHAHVLRYLVTSTDVPVQVVDDLGRNPLHDACWTHKPNFDLIKIIIEMCPDLLYISDNRGFTPLSYVAKPSWGKWNKFLEDNQDLLAPRELLVEPSDAVAF